MAKKKWLALALAATLSVGTLANGAAFMGAPLTVQAAKSRKVYGKPWINSNVYGMAKRVKKPSLKDDFYLSVNYDDFKKDVLRPGYASEGTLRDAGDIVDERIKSLMTDTSFTESYAKRVQDYYKMFLDWGSRNAAAKAHFEKHFSPIQAISDMDSLTAYLKSKESLIYGPSLFDISEDPAPNDPTVYTTAISSTSLSLGDSAEYKKMTPYGEAMNKAQRQKASYVLHYAGYDDAQVNQIMDECFAFEKAIAEAIMASEEEHSSDYVEKVNNPRSAADLRAASGAFPMVDILDEWGFGDSVRFNLAEPEWLTKLSTLYVPERFSQIKSYLLFHYAAGAMGSLDEAAFRENQRISRELNGISESRDDVYYAYQTTKSALWNDVDQMYVKKYCSQKMKDDIRGIMQDVVAAYKRMLRNEKWLTKRTRQRAIEKLDAIKLCPVYPDKWEDWSSLQFAGPANGGSLQAANDAISEFKVRCDLAKKNARVDDSLWETSCTDVNASYWPDRNRILIYAGILNGKIYNESMTEEEMLGTIGTVIGHEISHAFDPSGSMFSKTGAVSNWWTKADRKAFNKRAKKLINYFDDLVPYKNGRHYKGALVQGEATADLGAMKCMLSIAKRRKGFDYKKFFKANAVVWYGFMTEAALQNVYLQDPHPMDYMRINVTLAQFDEFQKTFHIGEDDGMYVDPADRINIW